MIDRFLRVDILVLLIHVGHLHGFAHFEFTAVGLLQSHDESEQGSLSGAVGTDDAYDTIGWQHEVKVIKEQFVAKGLGYMLGLDHLVAQTWTVGNEDFQLLFLLLYVFVKQFVVRVQTGLTLGLTCLGSHAHPLQFALQCLASFAGRLLLLLHAARLLLQPAGVVAFPGNALSTVQLKNPSGYVVQEVAVVGHGDDGTLVLLQMLLQPIDALGVKVVGRLVKQ